MVYTYNNKKKNFILMYLPKIPRVKQDIADPCFVVIILTNNYNDKQDNHLDNNENNVLQYVMTTHLLNKSFWTY